MTMQIPDKLHYNGEVYYLNQELLRGYFETFPEKKPESQIMTTALWRGYIATFELKDNQLFVKSLEIFEDLSLNTKLVDNLFPNKNKFEWYSGLIRIDSDRGYWDDEEVNHQFEYLEIFKGDFVQKRSMNFEELNEFKKLQFEYFKTTALYETVYDMWRGNNPDLEEEKIDGYIYDGLLRLYSREIFDNEAIYDDW